MNKEEANKILAEYMGTEINPEDDSVFMEEEDYIVYDYLYSDSLDALVSVWEKLDIDGQAYDNYDREFMKHEFRIYITNNRELLDFQGNGQSIQEAAAIATAKAIQEIEK